MPHLNNNNAKQLNFKMKPRDGAMTITHPF